MLYFFSLSVYSPSFIRSFVKKTPVFLVVDLSSLHESENFFHPMLSYTHPLPARYRTLPSPLSPFTCPSKLPPPSARPPFPTPQAPLRNFPAPSSSFLGA